LPGQRLEHHPVAQIVDRLGVERRQVEFRELGHGTPPVKKPSWAILVQNTDLHGAVRGVDNTGIHEVFRKIGVTHRPSILK
jgi:hypothetical protein